MDPGSDVLAGTAGPGDLLNPRRRLEHLPVVVPAGFSAYRDLRNHASAELCRLRAADAWLGRPVQIVDVGDYCDLDCPTCSAESTDAGLLRPASGVVAEALEHSDPGSTVMLSGGEPFLHPDLSDICGSIVEAGRRLVVITNGVAVASDSAALAALPTSGECELYLQFDSLRPAAIEAIRGRDLAGVRSAAVQNLRESSFGFSLVCVLMAGQNEDEVGDLVRYAWDVGARGITFQPIRAVGRTRSGIGSYPLPLDFVKEALAANQASSPSQLEMTPHPRDPHYVWTAWVDRTTGAQFTPIDSLGDTFFSPSTPENFRIASVSYVDTHVDGCASEGDLFRTQVADVGVLVSIQRRYYRTDTNQPPKSAY